MSWGLLLVLVSLVGVKTTKQSSGQFMIKRGNEKSAKQPSNVVEYSFDLNKTPPRESNEEIKPLSIKKVSNQKKIKGSTKGKPGRPKKYASEEARRIAHIENRKNYRKQFTKKGIEEAKKVLQGEQLKMFLLKAENYKEQARERQRRLKNIRTFKRTADESQRVAQRALGFHEKMKQGEGERNTQEKPLPDLNSSPPISPVENVEEGTKIPSSLDKNKNKEQSMSKSRGRLNKKYERQRRLARSYTKEGVKKAKATLQGEELNNFLIRANKFRLARNKFEKYYRKQMANRFLAGTQTIQDETRREKARQRARKSNEKRKRMSKKE